MKNEVSPPALAPEPAVSPRKLDSPFITIAEACRRLQVSRRSLVEWRRSGIIPSVRLGKAVRLHWPSVEAALLRRQQGLAA